MDLRRFRHILRIRWWLIVLQALLTAGAAYGFSAIQTPTYEASMRLYISSHAAGTQPQDMAQLLRSYATFLNSSLRAQGVVDELRLDRSAEQLLQDVEITPSSSDPTIEIAVESTHPGLASDIARVWAEQFVEFRRAENADLRPARQVDAEVLDAPDVRLVNPQTLTNTIVGLFFGGLMGLALAGLWEWIEARRIRDAGDAERSLQIPVLGSIPSTRSREV